MYRIDGKSPKVQLFRGILICTPLWVCSSPIRLSFGQRRRLYCLLPYSRSSQTE